MPTMSRGIGVEADLDVARRLYDLMFDAVHAGKPIEGATFLAGSCLRRGMGSFRVAAVVRSAALDRPFPEHLFN